MGTEDNVGREDTVQKKKKGAALAVTFENRQRRVRIFKSILNILGKPDQVRVLINKEDRMFAVQRARQEDRDAIRIDEKVKSGRTGFYINSVALLESVSSDMGWDITKNYRVEGTYNSDDMVIFMLDEARELS